MDTFLHVGKRLIKLREDKGLTQDDIERETGIPRSTYANYELGVHAPGPKRQQILCKFFGISIDFLMAEDQTKANISDNMGVDPLSLNNETLLKRLLKMHDKYESLEEKYNKLLEEVEILRKRQG